MEMVLIPAGEYAPAIPEAKTQLADAQPRLSIDKPFYIGKFEVTQEQYEAVMGKNPSHFKGATLPVEMVSLNDAEEFCKKVAKLTGKVVSLPSAIQWEFACRAGSPTRFFNGDGDADLALAAWYANNSEISTHGVGQKLSNAWGLHDMHGNVSEWTQDPWAESWKSNYMRNPDPLAKQVLHGGGWDSKTADCSSFWGSDRSRDDRANNIGFRIVISIGAR